MSSSSARRRGPGLISSILLLSPVLIGVPLYSYQQHSYLPEPIDEPYNSITKLPQISESRILEVSRILSEDIGFRTPGTREHALGEDWLWERVTRIKSECDELVRKLPERDLECEIWRQKGSGSHRFDMMGARLYKTYVDLGNIVVRLSDGTAEGKAHSVLVNSHLDSTLPTPGAADDAISVGIMLECIRVLVETKDWQPKHAIVFLFNNAEESLQDGSHLFSTQHEVADTVRAAINLEAAGTMGRELLFQASSKEMIEAYSHVPRPSGSVVANDVFSSGIILSDTDFRQFQEYLNVTGLDIAVVTNSYLYHMRKDLVENIQPGVAQNFGENTLALLLHLSSPPPTSPSIASLTGGYTKPQMVYFSLIGRFWMFSFQTAKILYTMLFVASVILVIARTSNPPPQSKSGGGSKDPGRNQASGRPRPSGLRALTSLAKPTLAIVVAFFGALVTANFVALLMKFVIGKPLSWFRNEYAPMVLYGPPAVLGALVSQVLFSSATNPITERQAYHALLLLQSFLAMVVQFIGIGSAWLLFSTALSLSMGLVMDPIFVRIAGLFSSSSEHQDEESLSLLSYALAQSYPLLIGSMSVFLTLEVFVPLTGRLGADAPADNLLATIVVLVGALSLPLLVPFVYRFQRGTRNGGRGGNTGILGTLIVAMMLVSAVPIAVFSARDPFDAMHQKRVYVMRTENITTGEHHLHLSTSDGASGFPDLVHAIAKELSAPPPVPENAGGSAAEIPMPEPIIMDRYNSDWDPMFPFSQFLTPYKIPLAVDPGYVSPWTSTASESSKFSVSAVDDVIDLEKGTRSLKLVIWHPGLIWTVIAFDAHVLKWNLDDTPPDEYTRHHVKEASYYGSDTWSIDLIIKLRPGESESGLGGILVNFIGLEEEGMWPGKKALFENHVSGNGKEPGLALKLFSTLDAWVEKETAGKVDVLLLGCVAGVQRL